MLLGSAVRNDKQTDNNDEKDRQNNGACVSEASKPDEERDLALVSWCNFFGKSSLSTETFRILS